MRKRLGLCLLAAAVAITGATACGKRNPAEETTTEIAKTTEGATQEEKSETDSTEKAVPLALAEYEFTKENFPVMDGSTSLAPLGKALVKAVLGESDENVEAMVNFNRTTQSYRNLMYETCDFLLASLPDEAVFDEMKECGFECEMEEISNEALIFVVNADNPVDSLTTQQIIDIYTGKITNWSEVGGEDAPIEAFQRNKGSGSQALMEKLIMKDTPMMEVESEYMPGEMGQLMEAVKSYNNSSNAIGYSVYYYANDMKMAEGLKIISIDGVEPNADTIRKKEYPHTNAYYCVINKAAAADSPARVLYDWIVSEEGQKLVAHEGYVSILDTGIASKETPLVVARYTRMQEEMIPDLKADSSYGHIYPFVTETVYDKEFGYRLGNKIGFVDETGRIVADPTYEGCDPVIDSAVDGEAFDCPVWIFSRSAAENTESNKTENGELEETYAKHLYGVATVDGRLVTECKYEDVRVSKSGIILYENSGTGKVTIIDYEGNTILTEKDFPSEIKNISYLFWSGNEDSFVVVGRDDTSYLLNSKGEKIAGPYGFMEYFDHGLSVVTSNDANWKKGVIDTKGNMVIPMEYELLSIGSDQYIEFVQDEKTGLMDLKGNVIRTEQSAGSYLFDTCGNYCFMPWEDNSAEDSSIYKFCNEKGEEVYSYDSMKGIQVGKTSIISYPDDQENTVLLENKITGASKKFEHAFYADCLWRISSSPEGMFEYDKDSKICVVGDKTGYLLDDQFNVLLEGEPFSGIGYDIANSKKYYYMGYGHYTVYDENLNKLMVSRSVPAVVNDLFMISDEYSSKLVDASGKEIFCYPFTNTLED